MKNTLFLILLLIGATFSVQAQSNEEASIADPINRLFKGMNTNDTTLIKSAFANEVTMATIARNKEGKPVIVNESGIRDFVLAMAKPNPSGPLSEEIWNLKFQIDGDFAHVWCDYALYVGKRFNHCGVDSFDLHKGENGWKIFHLADTRRKTDCNVPQNVQDKFK